MQTFLLCLPEAHSTCESQTSAPRYGMPMNRRSMALKQESSYPLVPVHPLISSRTSLLLSPIRCLCQRPTSLCKPACSSSMPDNGRVCLRYKLFAHPLYSHNSPDSSHPNHIPQCHTTKDSGKRQAQPRPHVSMSIGGRAGSGARQNVAHHLSDQLPSLQTDPRPSLILISSA